MELHDIQHHHILYKILDILWYNSKEKNLFICILLLIFKIITCTTLNTFVNDVLIIIKNSKELKFCTAV